MSLPRHIAIIMDGNGRWAKLKGQPRIFGHKTGTQSTREAVRVCSQMGIHSLTLYVFSSENWKRPAKEVNFLMTLLTEMIDSEVKSMMKQNVKLRVIGDMTQLPERAQKKLHEGILKTANNTGLNLNLAINYGGRQELVYAMKQIAQKIESQEIKTDEINESLIQNHLYNPEMPDVDLMIRTGGEFRISNYLLWQVAYGEIFVSSKLWPDFDEAELKNAIEFYSTRERRFGGVLQDNDE